MRFTPKSAKELAAGGLFPAGEYDFEVKTAEETTSKTSGAEMVKLTLSVFNAAGAKTSVFDYLVSSEKAIFKIRQFAAAVGLLEEYEAGELDALDMEGLGGKLKLKVESSELYGDKNSVVSYIAAPVTAGSIAKKTAFVQKRVSGLDDDIPF
jgi:hypothetical protein